jgi:hypothetical protein
MNAPHDPLTAAAPPTVCIGGCGRAPVARGMCLMHYKRFAKHGDINHVYRDGRRNHPLYSIWQASKRRGVIAGEWMDFRKFVAAVGERPTAESMLVRRDASLPYGPDNFFWRTPPTAGTTGLVVTAS